MKGAQFERDISRILSLWWTHDARDDVFWRTSQSGGRATIRSQKGLRTYGAYGDITAIDPIGVPLLKVFTIELKRGNTIGTPFACIEKSQQKGIPPWGMALLQTIEQWKNAGSRSWLLIHKRDRMATMAYTDLWCKKTFHLDQLHTFVEFSFPLIGEWKGNEVKYRAQFIGVELVDFLTFVDPEDVVRIADNKESQTE